MITVSHAVCGKSWTGLRPEHCASCHETFSTTYAGDRHRKDGPAHTRYCVHPSTVGLVERADGVWQRPRTPGSSARRESDTPTSPPRSPPTP